MSAPQRLLAFTSTLLASEPSHLALRIAWTATRGQRLSTQKLLPAPTAALLQATLRWLAAEAVGQCRYHRVATRQEPGPGWDSQEQELAVHVDFLKLALEVRCAALCSAGRCLCAWLAVAVTDACNS